MSLKSIKDFVLENYPISQTWSAESLEDWIEWANILGFLTLVRDDGGKLAGLAISRPMSRVDQYLKTGIEHDNSGRIIWVDLFIAPTKEIYQAAAFGILALMGAGRKSVAYMRRGKLKIHSLESARRALLK